MRHASCGLPTGIGRSVSQKDKIKQTLTKGKSYMRSNLGSTGPQAPYSAKTDNRHTPPQWFNKSGRKTGGRGPPTANGK